jgi:hypothetical protein
MEHFIDNDEGYFSWLGAHSDGFVVNCYRNPTASYLVLHRASCSHIQRWEGRRSTCDYGKVCSTHDQALIDCAERLGGTLARCGTCQP